ncbi:hypothetical protein DCD77_08240 [Acinetobacter baumannii]|uniref:hypothetical protein n=1 Tax=Acinetobacter baumannii TaxID=470 RepID=UPI000D34D354|nr:hypothetical protein [Acinetobacter baumannii]PUV05593.1 hypothetical protein DCD77_08240 [Acinetobacter baumannii]
MKTIICLLSSLLISASALAHENPDRIGKCFVVDGKNITKGCIISSGGGAGGMYTLLTIGEKEYLIEESTMNPDSEDRSISMGGDSDDLLEAIEYSRDFKTKKVIKNFKMNSWSCFKQIKGKLDVCYRTR